jgi:hypothetical protein
MDAEAARAPMKASVVSMDTAAVDVGEVIPIIKLRETISQRMSMTVTHYEVQSLLSSEGLPT